MGDPAQDRTRDLQRLNAVCPYYTMFPLEFPLRVLTGRAAPGDSVLDPFCGRGTTNYAARLLGLSTIGIDSSPVAVAISRAKLAAATTDEVVDEARRILETRDGVRSPTGEFWRRAYHPDTLREICRLRAALMSTAETGRRAALRGIIMGALHGPRTLHVVSHLSNQCPRTYAPKPDYAIRFWKKRHLKPPRVSLIEVVRTRAERYLGAAPQPIRGRVIHGDARERTVFPERRRFRWIITSPPYYGLRTYRPDQWLRLWFLGGASYPTYEQHDDDLSHLSADAFAAQLGRVWLSCAARATSDARLVIRFGGIRERDVDALEVLRTSFAGTPWRIVTARDAGSALEGKRQAVQFGRASDEPATEWDVYARLG